mgnify:FL=1
MYPKIERRIISNTQNKFDPEIKIFSKYFNLMRTAKEIDQQIKSLLKEKESLNNINPNKIHKEIMHNISDPLNSIKNIFKGCGLKFSKEIIKGESYTFKFTSDKNFRKLTQSMVYDFLKESKYNELWISKRDFGKYFPNTDCTDYIKSRNVNQIRRFDRKGQITHSVSRGQKILYLIK